MLDPLQAFADKLASRAITETFLSSDTDGYGRRHSVYGKTPGRFIVKLSAEDREKVKQLRPEHFKTVLRSGEMPEGDLGAGRKRVGDLLTKFDKEIMRKGYGKSLPK
jgi:hypothetical protein